VSGVNDLVNVVFSGLSPLVIEDVVDQGSQILVQARTPDRSVACPECGAGTRQIHAYYERLVADVAVDARRVVVQVRGRRLVCPTLGCVQTFREQVPGVVERYQRRRVRLASQIGAEQLSIPVDVDLGYAASA
jgi:transposase